jgi:eukaryotic-like serine/threonine-protein kinase
MTIAAGTKLDSYEVVAQIGAGGMGEVYQAHDTKLGRDVAIKVLPEAFAHDPERLARFQREAKMLASLNHPNIATIHGLEHSDSVQYLVMELVSGETLAERVKRDGAVPIEEALIIAKQIAEALEAAHEKGIIHRDLKPANVKVTPEGKVKVLDFGLAKAFEGETANEDMGNSPTLSRAATMQGVILGTAAYMSPEQARGKAVDKRTDIWAFGCVLFELLTGKQAFHGEDITDILAAVVRAEPAWQALPIPTPVKIRDLLRRCLQKDKTLRLRDAGDARIEIQEVVTAPSEGPTFRDPVERGWRLAAAFGLVAVVVAVIAGYAVWNLKPLPLPQRVTRTVITLPPGQELAGMENGAAVALSPDGTYLAYVASQGGDQQIYLRAMDSLEARSIAGTEGANELFFSPDGQWLGFFTGPKLKKISVSGGSALTLCTTGQSRGASWGSQGKIAFAPNNTTVLQEVSDSGGTQQPITHLQKGDVGHRWPEFLPGGKAMLFVAGGLGDDSRVEAYSIGTGEQRDLNLAGTQPRYAASGHLVFAQGPNLMAAPFDPQRLEVTGAAVPVVDRVSQATTSGGAQYSFSETGSLVYVSGIAQATLRRLVWVDRKGVEQALPAPPHAYRYPRLSPDGHRLAVTIEEPEQNIWLYDLARTTLTRLTFQGSLNLMGSWTPDGKRIAFESNREGAANLFWQLADGSGGIEKLTTSGHTQAPFSWSPDGQELAFADVAPVTGYDIWVLRMRDRKAQPFLETPYLESAPRFSPDGHWLAYVSDESGRFEVYVQSYPGPGGKWQISTEGGTEPVWNPNGRELFYRTQNKLMAVDIATQPSFSAGTPRRLFEGRYQPTTLTVPNYDVSPDGQRFLMLEPVEQDQVAPTQIVVVQNWFEELKQKVPTGKK